MVWYNQPKVQESNYLNYCYCELLLTANDLMLQGWLTVPVDNTWGMRIIAYKPDATVIADITSKFDFYFARDNDGNPFFTARLKEFPVELCSNCFILHVQVYKLNSFAFDQWTDIFCIGSCCQVPTRVDITDSGGNLIPTTTDPLPIAENPDLANLCLNNLIRLEGIYECEDFIGGNYYGIPATITGGNYPSGFAFRKISNIEASFKRGKREITKEISFNCKTQKVTSIRSYERQSYKPLPEWKVEELEDLLCAPYINVDGDNYLYQGGDDPFVLLNPKECRSPLYRFKIVLRDCSAWQIFGCNSSCNKSTAKYFGFQRQAESYYNENGQLIGLTFQDLKNYLQAQDGTYSVTEVTPTVGNNPGQVYNPYYKILKVQSKGIIQSFIYENNTGISSRIYGMELDESNPNYNQLFSTTSCKNPIVGTITFTTVICLTPIIGTISYSAGFYAEGQVESFGNWEVSDIENIITRNDYQVQMTFTTTNPGVIAEGETQISGQIGMVRSEFAPSQQRTISPAQNPSIPENGGLIIDPNGIISYIGPLPGPGPVTLTFTNISYPI